ncbi:hypothetical protein ACFWUZ_30040 [Streptomyces sp. NPDC058646]|uniref:hypothetical protein n=1 Tax=Streptomyces sp. NPDC058646 TaxID=3346574 RepID=UPI00364A05F3
MKTDDVPDQHDRAAELDAGADDQLTAAPQPKRFGAKQSHITGCEDAYSALRTRK